MFRHSIHLSRQGSPKKMVVLLVADRDNPVVSLSRLILSSHLASESSHDKGSVRLVVGADWHEMRPQLDLEFDSIINLVVLPPAPLNVLELIWHNVGGSIKWVHCFQTGIDFMHEFAIKHLETSGIPLTNAKGAFSSSLAEYIIGSILYFNKQFGRCEQNRQNRRWDRFFMDVLKGKTIGFVGFGDIAKTTALIAKTAFGMNVLALKRTTVALEDRNLVDKFYLPEKRLEMLSSSDVVVCTLPKTEDTIDFLSHREFGAMKDDSVFVSCGRGIVVNEDALDDALESGKLRGAALDVFREEPLPLTSPLWTKSNLLITAHNADLTRDYAELGTKIWFDNLTAFLSGKPLKTVVRNIKLGY